MTLREFGVAALAYLSNMTETVRELQGWAMQRTEELKNNLPVFSFSENDVAVSSNPNPNNQCDENQEAILPNTGSDKTAEVAQADVAALESAPAPLTFKFTPAQSSHNPLQWGIATQQEPNTEEANAEHSTSPTARIKAA